MACCVAAAYLFGLILRGLAAVRLGPLARLRPEVSWPPPARRPLADPDGGRTVAEPPVVAHV